MLVLMSQSQIVLGCFKRTKLCTGSDCFRCVQMMCGYFWTWKRAEREQDMLMHALLMCTGPGTEPLCKMVVSCTMCRTRFIIPGIPISVILSIMAVAFLCFLRFSEQIISVVTNFRVSRCKSILY